MESKTGQKSHLFRGLLLSTAQIELGFFSYNPTELGIEKSRLVPAQISRQKNSSIDTVNKFFVAVRVLFYKQKSSQGHKLQPIEIKWQTLQNFVYSWSVPEEDLIFFHQLLLSRNSYLFVLPFSKLFSKLEAQVWGKNLSASSSAHHQRSKQHQGSSPEQAGELNSSLRQPAGWQTWMITKRGFFKSKYC